jgi:Ca2+-binding EF-hand superfamily protein
LKEILFNLAGTIQSDEIAAALIACGIRVTDKMLSDLFAQSGKDINDELTFIEFAEIMTGGSSDMIQGDSSDDVSNPGQIFFRYFINFMFH